MKLLRLAFAGLLALSACHASALSDPQYATWADRLGTEASVRVKVVCADGAQAWGSGTAVGRDRLLTAKHLFTHCDDADLDAMLTYVVDSSKQLHLVGVKLAPGDVDLARLDVIDGSRFDRYAAVASEAPLLGEQVCWWGGDYDFDANGAKKCAYYAGEAENVGWVSGKGAPGNSGSGILNGKGELVGVLVMGDWNPFHDFVTGFTALAPIKELLSER